MGRGRQLEYLPKMDFPVKGYVGYFLVSIHMGTNTWTKSQLYAGLNPSTIGL